MSRFQAKPDSLTVQLSLFPEQANSNIIMMGVAPTPNVMWINTDYKCPKCEQWGFPSAIADDNHYVHNECTGCANERYVYRSMSYVIKEQTFREWFLGVWKWIFG